MAEVPIDIDHVARLARIALTDAEKQRFAAQFGRLFEFIGELQQLKVEEIPATAQVIPIHNALRDDELRPCLPQDEALANAPDREGAFFKTPRILE